MGRQSAMVVLEMWGEEPCRPGGASPKHLCVAGAQRSILEALVESRAEPGSSAAMQAQNWDDFILDSPAVSDAFLPEPASQEQGRREAL
jgi:hypothetical protein